MAIGFRMGVGGGVVKPKKIVLFKSGQGQINTDVMGILQVVFSSYGRVTINDDMIKLEAQSSSTSGTYNIVVSYLEKINTINIKSIHVHVTSISASSGGFAMTVSQGRTGYETKYLDTNLVLGDNMFNLSSVPTDSGYFLFRTGVNSVGTCIIDEIWVEMVDQKSRKYLYEDGNEHNAITGGWGDHLSPLNTLSGYSHNDRVTKMDTYIESVSVTRTSACAVRTENPIDFTDYNTISAYGIGSDGNIKHIIIDISDLAGMYYPYVGTQVVNNTYYVNMLVTLGDSSQIVRQKAHTNNSQGTFRIMRVWLDK